MNAWCVKWGIELNVRNVFRRRLREEITISIPDWSRQAIHGDNEEDYTLYFKQSWIDVRKIFLDSWDFIWRLLNQLEARAHWNCNTHLKKLFRFRELNLLESLKLWNPAWIYISYIVWESMMMPLPRTYFVTSALLAICCLRSNSQSQRHKCCTVWKISIWIKIYYWY